MTKLRDTMPEFHTWCDKWTGMPVPARRIPKYGYLVQIIRDEIMHIDDFLDRHEWRPMFSGRKQPPFKRSKKNKPKPCAPRFPGGITWMAHIDVEMLNYRREQGMTPLQAVEEEVDRFRNHLAYKVQEAWKEIEKKKPRKKK